MLFFVVVFGLAALAAADPETKGKIQQEQELVHGEKQPVVQEQEQVTPGNVIPFYKQVYNPFSSKVYGGYPLRNYWGYNQQYEGQRYGDYPHYPSFYKYMMSYPYRNSYYLKHLMSRYQPKVYYGPQDVYDYQNAYNYEDDYVNQPQVYAPGYYQQYTKKYNEDIEYPYVLPYSPSYYNHHAYKQGYPLKYYGKNLNLGTTIGKPWDVQYIRNYLGRHLSEEGLPISSNWEDKPLMHDVKSGVYYKPIISRNLGYGSALPTIPIKDMDVEIVEPLATKKPITSLPVFSRNVGLDDLAEPTPYELGYQYVGPKSNFYYGKYWDSDYLRSGYGKILKSKSGTPVYNYGQEYAGIPLPIQSRNIGLEGFGEELDQEYVTPRKPFFYGTLGDYPRIGYGKTLKSDAPGMPIVHGKVNAGIAGTPEIFSRKTDMEDVIELLGKEYGSKMVSPVKHFTEVHPDGGMVGRMF